MKLYLVRHGKTPWNLDHRMQGSTDIALAPVGIDDAIRVGIGLQAVDFTAVYSSGLIRTQQTAEHILGERMIPHFQHKGLNELHFGIWEGVYADTLATDPNFTAFCTNPREYDATLTQGETLEDFTHRVTKAFDDIITLHQHDPQANILVVAHGMVLTLYTALIKGLSWQQMRDPNLHQFIQNTSVSIVKVHHGKAQLALINHELAHLPLPPL